MRLKIIIRIIWTNILTAIATSDPNFSNGRRKPTHRERRRTKLERHILIMRAGEKADLTARNQT